MRERDVRGTERLLAESATTRTLSCAQGQPTTVCPRHGRPFLAGYCEPSCLRAKPDDYADSPSTGWRAVLILLAILCLGASVQAEGLDDSTMGRGVDGHAGTLGTDLKAYALDRGGNLHLGGRSASRQSSPLAAGVEPGRPSVEPSRLNLLLTYGLARGLDVGMTELALARNPHAREGNVFMARRDVRWAANALGVVLLTEGTRAMSRTHPNRARWFKRSVVILSAGLAVNAALAARKR